MRKRLLGTIGVRMRLLGVVLLFLAGWNLTATAAEAEIEQDMDEEAAAAMSAAREKNRAHFHIGLEFTNFSYEETDDGEELMSIKGSMPGLVAGVYRYKPVFWNVGMAYHGGDLKYDGQYQDGTPVETDTKDSIFELRGLLGGDLTEASYQGRSILYTGLGYRLWSNEAEGTGGYRRKVSYVYMPFGAEFAFPISASSRIGLRGELDALLYGRVVSYLSDVHPSLPNVENRQTSGYGSRLSCFIEAGGEKSKVFVELFMRNWSVAESELDSTGSFIEPENTTRIYGLGLQIVF